MKRADLMATALVAAALLLCGCGGDEPEAGRAGSGIEQFRQEAGQAAEEAAEWAGRTRDDIVESVQSRMGEIERDLEELRHQAAARGAEAEQEFQELRAALDRKLEAARQKLDEARRSGGERWEGMKDGVRGALDDAERAYQDLVSRFGKEEQ